MSFDDLHAIPNYQNPHLPQAGTITVHVGSRKKVLPFDADASQIIEAIREVSTDLCPSCGTDRLRAMCWCVQ